MLKTVILIGGPSNGTRFRPLSLDTPKPLFPVAGFPMIYHHIEAASRVPNMKEVILIGSYAKDQHLNDFMTNVKGEFKISIRYLQEYAPLGTAGALYHFRDQIQGGGPEMFFVMNADVCGDFPLCGMLEFHKNVNTRTGTDNNFTMLATEATRQQSLNYGCIVENKETHEVEHYVEKPRTFVSTLISCGIFLFTAEIFEHIRVVFNKLQETISFDVEDEDVGTLPNKETPVIRLEQDVFARRLAGSSRLFVYQSNNFWSQLKSAGAAIYANRHYLHIYHSSHPERLASNSKQGPQIIGDVYVHPSATIHPTACLGPNVTVEKNVVIGAGVRVREAMILEGAHVQDHCCVLHSIIGWGSVIGEWTRVEGTPCDPNPNKPFAKLDIHDLFSSEGKLNPSITVIGSHVKIPAEVIVLNSIVLPDKQLERSCKNQILL